MKHTFLIVLLIISVFQCCKTEINSPDYFIFGRYEDPCLKDCSNFIKYQSNGLYRDNVTVLSDVLDFNTTSLSLDHLGEVKALQSGITPYMRSHEGDIVTPNVDGKGAYYIETRTNNTIKKWRLDRNRLNIPDSATKVYLDQIIATCQLYF